MLYTSTENKKIKELKKIQKKKYRDLTNTFLVEGEHLVKEAYQAGVLKLLITKEGLSFPYQVETIEVTDSILKELSELDTPPKIMGVCNKLEPKSLGNRLLLLDGIQDPGNLGTIIRSAVAFSIDSILLGKDTVDIYNPKVLRATQGMIFHINCIPCDLLKELPILKQKNYQILGTKVTGGKDIKTLDNLDKFAIIMGNEGNGVRKEILNFCDQFVYIKMSNKCESLNVSIATSILLYELDK